MNHSDDSKKKKLKFNACASSKWRENVKNVYFYVIFLSIEKSYFRLLANLSVIITL